MNLAMLMVMGDEYRTDDDRDVSSQAELNVNTTTESDLLW